MGHRILTQIRIVAWNESKFRCPGLVWIKKVVNYIEESEKFSVKKLLIAENHLFTDFLLSPTSTL
jgi:hypothetical protein